MPLSQRYKILRNRIYALRRALLPRQFDPTGTYADRVHDRALGFRVLACAELEAYLEEVVQEAVRSAAEKWNSKRFANKTLVALAAFTHIGKEKAPEGFNTKENLETRVNGSVARFYSILKDSHGIRYHHTVPLVSMIGIEHSEIDEVWLADLDSFGRIRGDTAHSSSHARAKILIDPEKEWKSVIQLVDGAKKFDRTASKLSS